MFGNTWQLTIHALSSLDHISSNSLSGSDNQQLYRMNYTGSTIQDQSQLHGNHKYGRSRRCYWRDVHQNHCAVNRWGRWLYQLDVTCWVTVAIPARRGTLSQSTTGSTVQLEQWLRSGPCVKTSYLIRLWFILWIFWFKTKSEKNNNTVNSFFGFGLNENIQRTNHTDCIGSLSPFICWIHIHYCLLFTSMYVKAHKYKYKI